MIWRKEIIKFDVHFMDKVLRETDALKLHYLSSRDIKISKESRILPQYFKLIKTDGIKGNFYQEYLFGYINGTLTMVYKEMEYGLPLECQIPYSEWVDYSYFVVCGVTKNRNKRIIYLDIYRNYES